MDINAFVKLLRNIPLSPDEHLQVVNKLCCSMEELPPQELPTLVHEMLELCKDKHGLLLLMKLNHYFHLHLYKNRRQNSNDLASSQMLESDNIGKGFTVPILTFPCYLLNFKS